MYLAGFMGSGKSTIGPILANAIGYSFIDLDSVIESQTGCTIEELFRKEGEEKFRERERSALRSASKSSLLVIALGGGALTDAASLAIVRETGIVVYLRVPLDELIGRLHGRHGRPLLTTEKGEALSPQALRERVTALFAARESIYMQSEVIVDTEGRTVGLTVDHIVKKLSAYLPQ